MYQFADNMDRPKVRKEGKFYIFRPTQEAKDIKAKKRETFNALPHEKVHEKAVKLARERGLLNPDQNTLRGFYEIQIGEYQGQTFHWLVENDMGYVTYLLC